MSDAEEEQRIEDLMNEIAGAPKIDVSALVDARKPTFVAPKAEKEPKQGRRWDIPIGPQVVKPGKTERYDLQPKCKFRVEKIAALAQEDLHLTGVFVGREEILKLGGDSIAMDGREISVEDAPLSDPAYTVSLEVTNRGKTDRTLYSTLYGTAFI